MIRLSPHRTDAVSAATREISRCAHDAEIAPDMESKKVALDAIWSATRRARELINDAEREARSAALAKVEQAA